MGTKGANEKKRSSDSWDSGDKAKNRPGPKTKPKGDSKKHDSKSHGTERRSK